MERLDGATGYLIQQSPSGTSGWAQIGTTSGSTTLKDTGLTAGTTYYFRVIATLGTLDSAASNVASATTTGTAPSADSIWPSTYVPTENAYSFGSYELGVKFTSSVAGEVTGIRFFKQTWMSGQTDVGHLWSSTGTLLATATFTNESGSGWQQVNFSSPVEIAASTVYIASYSTSGGYFGITTGFFSSGGVTNGPLQALSNSVTGGDGVYNRAGAFPSVDSYGMNFWTDVAFTPASTSGAPAAALSRPSGPASSNAITVTGSTGSQTSQNASSSPATTLAGPLRHRRDRLPRKRGSPGRRRPPILSRRPRVSHRGSRSRHSALTRREGDRESRSIVRARLSRSSFPCVCARASPSGRRRDAPPLARYFGLPKY